MNKTNLFVIGILGIACMLSFKGVPEPIEPEPIEIRPDSVDLSLLDLSKDNFFFVCHYYGIDHPEIVYAQAQLESGRFSSKVFKEKNNFLGLYNSYTNDYYSFNHWSHCLKGYRDYVQSKWDKQTDYLSFLKELPYAADPEYINKINRLK